VRGPVGVAGTGPRSFWLGALHYAAHTSLSETEHLRRCFDRDTHLVVILSAGQSGAVRRRTDLDQQDR
jgi:hypothetical protein